MQTVTQRVPISKGSQWTGWILSALVILFLIVDCSVKLLKLDAAIGPTVRLGYPADLVFPLGAIELVCLLLYAVPSTSVLGAILLTGYLGGATATHVRIGDPFFFPVVVGVMAWAGIYLRDGRVRRFPLFRF